MSRSSGDHGFVDIIFSWSLEDIFNEDLYKDKVCIVLFCIVLINKL